MTNDGNIHSDRTGGSRRKARVKPPVASFSETFIAISDPPQPKDILDLQEEAVGLGFSDANTDQAEFIFGCTSYQHLSDYFHLFRGEDGSLAEKSSMKMVHRAMLFDRKFQNLLFEYIGLFELKFRAQYSYAMTIAKGPFAHRNIRNFKDAGHYSKFLKAYETEFNRQLRKRNATILRDFQKYGDAPTWRAVEIMSFGTLSMLYKNTKSRVVRERVARSFALTADELSSWTRALSEVRNTCAHFGKLIGTKLVSRPKKIPDIPDDNGSPFYIVLMLLYLLRDDRTFSDDTTLMYQMQFMKDTVQLFDDFEDVLDTCQIPHNWIERISDESILGREVTITEEHVSPGSGNRVRAWFNGSSGEKVEITNILVPSRDS